MGALAQPIEKIGLAVQVADRIRQSILGGEIGVGERINEVEVAASLGVSRGPVRDAILLLRRDGLLDAGWHRGAHVRALTLADAHEIYSLRAAIETLAVERTVALADAPDLARLRERAEALESVAQSGSQSEMLVVDVAFHEEIYAAARHERLFETWVGLRSQICLLLLNRQGEGSGYREAIAAEHWAIYAALHRRDAAEATRLVRTHITEAGGRVIARLTQSAPD